MSLCRKENMKRYLFVLAFILSQSVFAKVPYFLSSSELNQLTENEQISYFIEVQKIIVEMSENSSYMANLSQFDRLAASTDEDDMYLMMYLKENKISKQQYEDSRVIAIDTPFGIERDTEEYKKAHKIWNGYNKYHASQLNQKKYREFNEAEKKERKDKEAFEKTKRDQEMLEAEVRHKEWMKNYKIPKSSLIEDTKKALEKIKKIEKKQETQKVEKTLVNEYVNSDFRKIDISKMEIKESKCLFAGWILNGDRCRGPQEFPADFHIPGVDREKMKCENNQFLCQPLLFGLKLPKGCDYLKDCADQALPLCVNFDSSITKICQLRSASTTKVAVELATQKDSNLFEQYRGQFYSLCEPEMLSRNSKIQKNEKLKIDVEKTCKVAREKLQLLYLQRVNSESSEDEVNSKPLQK